MRKQTKTMMMSVLCMATVAAAGFGVASTVGNVATAKAEVPELIIAGQTLTVNNNVNVNYYMNTVDGYTASDFRLKVVEKAADGTETTTVLQGKEDNSQGVPYYKFTYTGVAADEMANALYATAYLAEDETVKSETIKYGVLNYAFNMLGLANKTATTDAKVIKLLNAMLAYGAAAEELGSSLETTVDYKTDYVYLSIANATFDDGFSYGLYKVGDEVTVTPDTGFGLSAGASGFVDNGAGGYTYEVPSEKPDLGGTMEEQETSAADMIAHEKESLTLDFTEAKVGDVKTLPVAADAFDQVTITWSATNATIEENVVTFTAVGTATLTATFSCDGAETQTKDFMVTVAVNPYPVAETEYALKGVAGNSKTYYVSGSGSSRLNSSENEADALAVYFEADSGDNYYIYYFDGETKTYIGHSSSTTITFNTNKAEATSWTLDVENEKIMSTVATDRWLGINTGTSPVCVRPYNTDTYKPVWFEEIRELTDSEKIDVEIANLEKTYSTIGGVDLALPTEGTTYSNVSIAWELVGEYDFVTSLENGLLVTTNPDGADQIVTVKATLICGEDSKIVEDCTITVKYVDSSSPAETLSARTYTFSSYTAGTQYAQGEAHQLDDDVTLIINGAHLNSEVRLYAGSNAVLAINEGVNKVFGGTFSVNAGKNAGTLTIYASVDGETWVKLNAFSTTSTYKDYSVVLDASAGYKYIKMESAGAQIRVKTAKFA